MRVQSQWFWTRTYFYTVPRQKYKKSIKKYKNLWFWTRNYTRTQNKAIFTHKTLWFFIFLHEFQALTISFFVFHRLWKS